MQNLLDKIDALKATVADQERTISSLKNGGEAEDAHFDKDGGEVARFVLQQLPSWRRALNVMEAQHIHVKDFSASGGARVYKVWHDTEATPAAVILKAEGKLFSFR